MMHIKRQGKFSSKATMLKKYINDMTKCDSISIKLYREDYIKIQCDICGETRFV